MDGVEPKVKEMETALSCVVKGAIGYMYSGFKTSSLMSELE